MMPFCVALSKSSFMYVTTVSDESTRVCLQPIRGVDGSDYINASFIDVSTEQQLSFLRFIIL